MSALGAPPGFELQAKLDLHAPGDLAVDKVAPSWHPAAPRQERLGLATHIDGGGAVARGALASRMLDALRDGFDLQISAPAWFAGDSPVDVTIAATRFHDAYDEFLSCAATNVNVAWAQLSRTRITYETDEHELTQDAERLLAGIARFVAQDPSVEKIYVDGHTDGSGTKVRNHALSKRRATTVAECLRKYGIDREVVVRFHGAAYPVADNATFAGKAANRRTTVRLERASPQAIARND